MARKTSSPQDVQALLTQTGLSAGESRVYLTLLQNGQLKATELARLAKLQRPHVYPLLQSLEKRGLVTRAGSEGVERFGAEDPSLLLEHLRENIGQLTSLSGVLELALPQLLARRSREKGPLVTVSQGLAAMKRVYKEMLSKPFISIFNPELTYKTFGMGTVQLVFGTSKQLHGRELLVQNAATREYMRQWKSDKHYEFRLLPKGIEVDIDAMISGDTVTLFFYDEQYTVVRIDNARLAKPLTTLFENLWKTAKQL